MKKTIACLSVLSVAACLSSPVLAQEDNPTAPIPADQDHGMISNGAFLGVPWWTKNPKQLEVIPEPLLYHFELNYSYSESAGNVDMQNHSGTGNLILRKKLVSSMTALTKSYTETTINLVPGASATQVESQNVSQDFVLALTPTISVGIGGLWLDNDSTKYIDERQAYYGGVLWHPLDTPQLNFSIFAAYGYMETAYMNNTIIKGYSTFQPVPDYDTDAAYFNLQFRWGISEMITFSETANCLVSLEDSEYYTWKATSKLDFKLSENISFFTQYVVDFDNNAFVEGVQDYLDAGRALGLPAGEMDDTDTTLSAGITLRF
ncbi:MAG: DUF481 domain-containing protein [Candidatus Electrothrix sp. EH2]|nr:DUF481 domain-containing protein [Candidatus Electrothrix sp. EH2]